MNFSGKKKNIATFVLSVSIVAIIFSPFPGIEAVSIALSGLDLNLGIGDTEINVDITVREPSAITLPSGINEETLTDSVVRVTIDPGTPNQKLRCLI